MNDAVAFLPNFILVKTRVTHSAASFAVTRKLTQKNYDVDLNWLKTLGVLGFLKLLYGFL